MLDEALFNCFLSFLLFYTLRFTVKFDFQINIHRTLDTARYVAKRKKVRSEIQIFGAKGRVTALQAAIQETNISFFNCAVIRFR